jgi:hypothetical protein
LGSLSTKTSEELKGLSEASEHFKGSSKLTIFKDKNIIRTQKTFIYLEKFLLFALIAALAGLLIHTVVSSWGEDYTDIFHV